MKNRKVADVKARTTRRIRPASEKAHAAEKASKSALLIAAFDGERRSLQVEPNDLDVD